MPNAPLNPPPNLVPPGGLGWKPGRGRNPGAYPLAPKLRALAARPAGRPRTSRRWPANGWWGNQGRTSACTVYAWLHALADGPVTHPHCPAPLADPAALYREGQAIDGTPSDDVDSGLTSDAAAQVMKRRGWITAYHWAADADEIAEALLSLGPVVFGATWRSGMTDPGRDGRVTYTGRDVGGHQTVLDGIDLRAGLVRGKNSWGRGYGARGFYYLPIADLARMMRDGADACVATEAAFDAALPLVART